MSSPFLTSIKEFMQVKRYSQRTIHAYIYWIKDYIRFNKMAHPTKLGSMQVTQYLTYLACQRHVSASTQALALNAIAFLYNKFLQKPLTDLPEFTRPQRQQKLPIVLTQNEVKSVLNQLEGSPYLMAALRI